MSKELSLTPALNGIEKSKAEQIESIFAPMVEMLKGFEKEYSEVIVLDRNKENCKRAKELRIAIGKIRIAAEKERKKLKDQYLIAGRAIDGVNNILKFAVSEKETALKEMEDHFDNIEKEKILKIASERLAKLKEYGMEECSLDLGTMEDNIWESFLFGAKAKFEAIKEEEEALRKATEEAERMETLETNRRIELAPFSEFIEFFNNTSFSLMSQEEFDSLKSGAVKLKDQAVLESENIKKENDRLKEEADIREAELAEERRIAKEKEDARLETEKAERLETQRLEAEIAEKEKADREAEKKKLSAPDKEKLLAFALEVKNMEFPSLKTEEAKQILSGAIESINNASAKIEQEAIKL